MRTSRFCLRTETTYVLQPQVVQGVLLAGPRSLTSREQLSRLWLHEACRVFHDRLTCEEDRGQFKHLLVSGAV